MTPAQKTLAGNPWFPFCGERCKMADLSNWFDGV
ncbi:MAG: DNA gyrase inhibitor YacG, partial [bacterium]|nr:DNA gyrase inhibitor YacG [bacterium]